MFFFSTQDVIQPPFFFNLLFFGFGSRKVWDSLQVFDRGFRLSTKQSTNAKHKSKAQKHSTKVQKHGPGRDWPKKKVVSRVLAVRVGAVRAVKRWKDHRDATFDATKEEKGVVRTGRSERCH